MRDNPEQSPSHTSILFSVVGSDGDHCNARTYLLVLNSTRPLQCRYALNGLCPVTTTHTRMPNLRPSMSIGSGTYVCASTYGLAPSFRFVPASFTAAGPLRSVRPWEQDDEFTAFNTSDQGRVRGSLSETVLGSQEVQVRWE